MTTSQAQTLGPQKARNAQKSIPTTSELRLSHLRRRAVGTPRNPAQVPQKAANRPHSIFCGRYAHFRGYDSAQSKTAAHCGVHRPSAVFTDSAAGPPLSHLTTEL